MPPSRAGVCRPAGEGGWWFLKPARGAGSGTLCGDRGIPARPARCGAGARRGWGCTHTIPSPQGKRQQSKESGGWQQRGAYSSSCPPCLASPLRIARRWPSQSLSSALGGGGGGTRGDTRRHGEDRAAQQGNKGRSQCQPKDGATVHGRVWRGCDQQRQWAGAARYGARCKAAMSCRAGRLGRAVGGSVGLSTPG